MIPISGLWSRAGSTSSCPSSTGFRTSPPRGTGDLEQFLHVLAAPLAAVRQNIEELYANLFINSCNDWVIPYLADMVGTDLVFPDARSNRQDVRGTVRWRRSKGTPAMLEDMSSELTGMPVVSHEGWKRLMASQDLRTARGAQ